MSSPRILTVLRSFYVACFKFFHVHHLLVVVRQVATMGLALVLVSNQALAGPVPAVITGAMTDLGHEMRFRWHTSSWAAAFNRWLPRRPTNSTPKGWDGKGAPWRERPASETPERTKDRERRVARINIYPGDVRIETGQQIVFNAIAYDRNGGSIGGLDFEWAGWDEEKNVPVSLPRKAIFISASPGRFRLTAKVAGHQDQVTVTVTGMERTRMLTGQPVGPLSTDRPSNGNFALKTPPLASSGDNSNGSNRLSGRRANGLVAQTRRRTRAAASPLSAMPVWQVATGYEDTWNESNGYGAFWPGNERGWMPGRTHDTGMGSGNFQFDVPIINLIGRGAGLDLGFRYNSRVWTKVDNTVYFNIDKDAIPGWSTGFGKIIVVGNTYVLFDGDGTRHPATGTSRGNFPAPATSLQSFEGHTTDGTFIDYYAEGYMPQFNGGYMLKAWAMFPNGTRIDYGASEIGTGKTGAMYPTQITDANGNYISITYRGNQGPNVETITDSLGRVIQFHYDSGNLLTAITAPGFNGGPSRVLVRLAYDTKNLGAAGSNYGFSGVTTMVRSSTFPAVRAIYFPATGTGYWFGDADSYSPYGMIRKVSERRGMSCSASGGDCGDPNAALGQQASIGAGAISQEQTYSHPSLPGYSYPHISGSLTDVPTFTQLTMDWAARETASAPVTYYSVADNGTRRTLKIIRPDGVRAEQDSDNNSSSATFGQLLEDRTYPDAASTTLLSRTKTDWEIGDGGNPRPTRTEATDQRGQTTSTTYAYGPRNQVVDIRQYGYNNNLLRRTHNEYENGGAYLGNLINSGTLWWHQNGLYNGPDWSGPHLFNLVKITEIYGPNDTTRESRVEYSYDEFSLQDTPGVTHHQSAPAQRGNLTSIERFANAVTLDSATSITETRYYDVCGNVIKIIPICCGQTSLQFTANTQYAWPEAITSGSASDGSAKNTISAVYDFNTELVKSAVDADGRTSQTVYDNKSLRPVYEYAATGAYGYHIYDDANLVVYDFAYEAGQSDANFASRSDKYIDGLGRVHGKIAYGKDYVLDVVETKFDNLGRLWQQTRPYRSPGEDKQWTTYDYDKLDRVIRITAPDGSMTDRIYNESSYPSAATQGVPGQTVRTKDPLGRERWARLDEQDRLVEVVEPDPNGTGAVASNGLLTQYSYDTLGNLIQSSQGGQTRRFKYDSLSRLTHQKLAERSETLDGNGRYVGDGAWSDVYFYDTRSNVIQKVDARGVRAYYNYNNDPLNRLQSVQYDKGGVPSAVVGNIPDAPNVSYAYVTTGDKTRPLSLTVANGMGNESYAYDSEARLSRATQTFTGRESYPLVTDYVYDSLDRRIDTTYPQQWGTSAARKTVHQTYDIATRINSLSYDGTSFASNFVYNAASQTTSLNVGSQISENYSYDQKTGLLTAQQVVQGANTLVNLKYNYTQNNDANNNGAKTGQLTGITDLKNQTRNRAYEYDKIGRLSKVKGGTNAFTSPAWYQNYSYDRYGNRSVVNNTGTVTWVDDALPPGASPQSDGGDSWMWRPFSQAPYSGTVSLQSDLASGLHQYAFYGATATMTAAAGERFFVYVYLDQNTLPSEIMLQWNNGSWEHRAYWGANNISLGTDGTNSRRYMGALPAAGSWVRLEVPASAVGLEGQAVTGMSLTLYGGRANWDRAGKAGTGGDTVWFDDALPTGAIQGLGSSTPIVSLKSANNYYVGAQQAGGGDVTVDASAIGPWERFTLIDVNGGSLESGDSVNFLANDGVHYLRAEGGGAPVGSTPPLGRVYATSTGAYGWETFVIRKSDGSAGPIGNNSQISLRSEGGFYFCAEGGGAPPGSTPPNGQLFANRTAVGPWETFTLVASGDSTAPDVGETWTWVGASPVPYTGAVSHQSNIASGMHQHYFTGATQTLPIAPGDKLQAFVWMDPQNPPTELMLQWNENGNWEHRAYWGANSINFGTDGTNSRRYMGTLPSAGGWVKLEVPANLVGLENTTVSGMAFTLYGGRASWDLAGKTSGVASPMPIDGQGNLTYNTATNRINSPGFEYDPAGNQIRAVVSSSGGQMLYQYDAAGRLARVLDGGGGVRATYGYGADSQRLMSVEGSVTTYYGWDADAIIAEYDGAGTSGLQWRTSYIYLGGVLLATTDASGTRFHHPDRLGTRLVTDAANGEVVAEQLTLPFGTMQSYGVLGGDNSYQHPTKNNPSKKRFTSYDRSDATGLDYAVNRFYSNQQGRFTQVDPIGIDAVGLTNPQTLNLYTYCGNDPVNSTDPDGLLFGFLKKLFKGVVKVVNAVVKVAKVVALAATAAVAVLTLNVPLLVQSTLGLLSEIGPRSLRQIAGFAGAALGAISGGGLGSFRTPGTVQNGTGVGGVSDYIFYFDGDEQLAKTSGRLVRIGGALGRIIGTVVRKLNPVIAVIDIVLQLEVRTARSDAEDIPQKKVPNPGGMLGKAETRAQIEQIADDLESQGYTITGGGGRLPEEYIPGAGPGTRGSVRPDITATRNGETLRVQTVDTLADGVTPTPREAKNAAKIRARRPNDQLKLVPKPKSPPKPKK